MTLHRFFVPPETVAHGDGRAREEVNLSGEQAHQIRRVLRLRPGYHVVLLTGDLREWVVQLTEIGPEFVSGVVTEERQSVTEPKISLTLYQSVVKGAKFDLILQRCTEVGVSAFVQVRTERSIPGEQREGRIRRYRSILREAAEQSGRGRLPALESLPYSFEEALERARAEGVVVVLWENECSVHLRDIVHATEQERIGLFVGPEGGFTESEIHTARVTGAHVVTIGPRILRSETAAIVGSALLLARNGDLG